MRLNPRIQKNTMKYLLLLPLFLIACNSTQNIGKGNNDIQLTPIFHGALVIQQNEQTIFIDPYGGAERYADFPAPDLVLISHPHGDHLNPETLNGLDLSKATLLAPQAVLDKADDIKFARTKLMENGDNYIWQGVNVEAVPMYNLPESPESRHPKGWGNGYVLTIGGERIYVSGDTEDIPEMRNLKNVDHAFVCMNLPYTMTIQQAASAVLEFKPKHVYPYHFRGKDGFSDVEQFKSIVTEGDDSIEVELLEWYTEL